MGRILLLTARGDKDGMSLLLLALGAAGAQLMWTVTMSLTQRYNERTRGQRAPRTL